MKTYFKRFTLFLLLLFLLTQISFAQKINFPEPREEKLLNGLKVLVWNQPNTGKVTVKIRVHSGSAFDPQDKMGTMVLLGNILFPQDGIRQFFEEDLDGSLEIINTYDYLQINATAKADEFVSLLETLAPAISNPSIDKEKTAKIKAGQLEKLKELENDPSYIADRAIAERLLGDFPYGRPIQGTTESVNKIDFADLIFAEQRFFNADNATLAIIGDVKPDFAYKAARRLFGAWKKGDKKVPATFTLPDEPDSAPLIINVDEENSTEETRLAVNASARNDKDYYATGILADIWQKQFCQSGKFIYEPYLLRGTLLIENSKPAVKEVKDLPVYSGTCGLFGLSAENGKVAISNFSKQQFDESKNKIASEISKKYSDTDNLAEFWFELSTYKLNSVKDEINKLNKTTYADVQKVYNEIVNKFKNKQYATVSVVPLSEVKDADLPKMKDPNDPKK